MIERRKCKRAKPGDGLQAVADYSPLPLLKLHDINPYGLGIVYIADSTPLPQKMVLDLFYWGGATPLWVKEVKCETVYDIPERTSHMSYRGLDTMRRGLVFSSPNLKQARNLDRIMKKIARDDD